MSENDNKQSNNPIDALVADAIAGIVPLTSPKPNVPGNIWETSEIYIDRLKTAAQWLERIKAGCEVVIIAVDRKVSDKSHVFVANMEPSEAIVRLSEALTKFANYEQQKKQPSDDLLDE